MTRTRIIEIVNMYRADAVDGRKLLAENRPPTQGGQGTVTRLPTTIAATAPGTGSLVSSCRAILDAVWVRAAVLGGKA